MQQGSQQQPDAPPLSRDTRSASSRPPPVDSQQNHRRCSLPSRSSSSHSGSSTSASGSGRREGSCAVCCTSRTMSTLRRSRLCPHRTYFFYPFGSPSSFVSLLQQDCVKRVADADLEKRLQGEKDAREKEQLSKERNAALVAVHGVYSCDRASHKAVANSINSAAEVEKHARLVHGAVREVARVAARAVAASPADQRAEFKAALQRASMALSASEQGACTRRSKMPSASWSAHMCSCASTTKGSILTCQDFDRFIFEEMCV